MPATQFSNPAPAVKLRPGWVFLALAALLLWGDLLRGNPTGAGAAASAFITGPAFAAGVMACFVVDPEIRVKLRESVGAPWLVLLLILWLIPDLAADGPMRDDLTALVTLFAWLGLIQAIFRWWETRRVLRDLRW